MRLRALLATVMLLIGCRLAEAQAVSGSYSLNGRNIPLPPGAWEVVATATPHRNVAGGAGYGGRNQQVALMLVSGGRVSGLVLVDTSLDVSDHMAGWAREAECARNDIHAAVVGVNVARDQDCWTLNHVLMSRGQNASEFTNAYYAAAAARGGMPPTMLRVTSRRADQMHYISVRYLFAPDAARFGAADAGWIENPWHRDRLDAARTGHIEALKRWAATAHAAVLRGFRGGAIAPLAEP